MNHNDRPRFLRTFTGACEYWDKKYSEALLDIYWNALVDLPVEQVEYAFNLALRSAKFFPKIAELREFVCAGDEEQSLAAWEQVLLAFSRSGADGSVTFADGRIARVIELLGGWVKLCGLEGQEAKWSRIEFLKIYKQLQPGGGPKTLYGRHELENRAKGYLPAGEGNTRMHCIPAPTMIGTERQIEHKPQQKG